jgi:RHS repeat-associated protein
VFRQFTVRAVLLFVVLLQEALAAPVVTLTAPAANTKYVPPASITLSANASDSSDSITKVEFYQGSTLVGTANTAPYTVNWSNVPAGSYSLTAKATNTNNVTATSAPVNVIVNTAPTVTLTAPANGASFPAVATVALTTNANDADGNLSKAEFFNNGNLIGTVTAAPYTYTWTGVQPGNYVITARATDSLGGIANSPAVSFSVTNPLTVSLTAPVSGAKFAPSSTITLTADATDSNGTITKVEFYRSGTLIGTATAAPYTVNWTNVPGGNYSITAKATDNQGLSKTSNAVNVTIGVDPVVNLTAPAANSSYMAPATITLSATASDSDGAVNRVEFLRGTSVLATVFYPPYTYEWKNVAAGSYSLSARVVDNLGVAVTSAPVTVQVNPNIAPTISLVTPTDNQKFAASSNILLNATASDNGGTVSKVEFFRGATLLGTVTEAPYLYLWTNVPAGNYALTAKATDNGGLATTSTAVNVSVVNNVKPTVSITATPTTATAPANISLAATASDSDGTITRVDFYNGSTPIGSVTQAPYTFNWTVMSAGDYSITARATDDMGGVTVSAPVNVDVTGNGTQVFYIEADHLNTPRVVMNAGGNAVWQWDYSDPFGNNVPNENPNGQGSFAFNLRFPGQYFDKETNLHYNLNRDYDPQIGRYLQSDPIGLKGGINTYAYVMNNPLRYIDPLGLFGVAEHSWITQQAIGEDTSFPDLPANTAKVDFIPGSQNPINSYWHAMRDGKTGQSVEEAESLFNDYIARNIAECTPEGLARAMHAAQDSAASGHRGFQPWSGGIPSPSHIRGDILPSQRSYADAIKKSKEILDRYRQACSCEPK